MVKSKLKIKIFTLAMSDMDNILDYITNELGNPHAAVNLIHDFEKAFENIGYFPEKCPFVNNEFLKDGTLRKLSVRNYLIFYRIRNEEVQIVRVLYRMCDYESLL